MMAPEFDPSEMTDADYEWGIPAGYKNQALRLSTEEAKSEDDAMAYLRRSLTASAEVTPLQGLATAILAAIPTFGGYLIGKSVGDPNIPAGVNIDLSKYPTGGAAGGLMGTEIGAKSAGTLLAGLDADKKQANDVYEKMASIEQQRANRLDAQKQSLIQAGLNQQSEIDMLPLREQSQLRLQNNAAANSLENSKSLDDYRSNKEKLPPDLLSKQDLKPEDLAGLNPDQIRALTNFRNSGRLQDQFEFKKKQSAIPGYTNNSGVELRPETAAKLAEQNFGVAKTNILLDQYLSMPDAFTGDESAVQQAISGMLVNAQRQATGSGASFTKDEMSLVKAALPHIAAGDLTDWVKQNALGRNQQVFAQTLKGIYQKTQDYALAEAYGQFRDNAPEGYYPESVLDKWGLRNDRTVVDSSHAPGTAPEGNSQPGTVPSVGSTFNGKKVLKVTRIN